MNVTLREVTAQNVRAVCRLAVDPTQAGYVAPNAVSLAEALVYPEAWYRAIYAGDEPAGFVMVYDEALRPSPPAAPKVGLWRLMVDARFQGQGVGKAALEQVIAHVRAKGVCSSFVTSYVPGPRSPEPFYSKLGFRPTGEMDGDEVVLALRLEPVPSRRAAGPSSIRRCESVDDAGWLELREALWSDCPREEHLAEMRAFCEAPERFGQFVALDGSGRAVGLAEAAIRTDYVNGAMFSPVAYLEGLYVRPGTRRQGIARALVAKVEEWGRGRGCRELASDALIDNTVSHATHRALGFEETDRVVFFRKARLD